MPVKTVIGMMIGVVLGMLIVFTIILLLVLYKNNLITAEGMRSKLRSFKAQRHGAERFHNDDGNRQEHPQQNGNSRVTFDNQPTPAANPDGVAVTIPGDNPMDFTLKSTEQYSNA